ncbi:N1221-like protein-domain-containing protein [Chytridium lagenaria]|nr:N1221-like protein-domain-containing protein [Chytridium lagenaria]
MKSIRLPPPVIAAPRPIYSTLLSTATISQPPSNPAGFISLPPTPPPYLLTPEVSTSTIASDNPPGEPTTEQSPSSTSKPEISIEDANAMAANDQPPVAAPPTGLAALSKSIRESLPARIKPKQFEFQYADRDHFEAEINEFYNYQDKLFIQEGKDSFERSFEGEWKTASMRKREGFVFCLLEGLESSKPEDRYIAAKKLLYIAQGVFGEVSTVQDQIELMKSNSKLLFDLDAFSFVHRALRVVSKTLDELTKGPVVATVEKQTAMDLANAETSVYLSLCYLLIEANYNNPKLAEEISSTAGVLGSAAKPIAVELFELIAQLAEGNRKHYPVKKQKEASRINEGLPEIRKDAYLKSTPQDIHTNNLLYH